MMKRAIFGAVLALAGVAWGQDYQVISKGGAAAAYSAFPDMCRLKNGDILAVFYNGYGHVSLPAEDLSKGGRICMVRSSDEGRTWSAPEILFDDADDNRDAHVAELDDGTLVCTFFSWQTGGKLLKSSAEYSAKYFRENAKLSGAQVVFSRDGGKTWDKEARLLYKDWVSSAPVRQMPDGSVFLGLYGPDPAKKRSRPAIARSADRGKTWDEVIPIDVPEGVSLDAETDVIRLKDGTLYAALRSDKHNMHFSRSNDGGRTWGEAADIGFKGHCPHLYRLSTGEIVLSHRLPNTSVHISRDECKTWEGPFEIDNVIGAYPACVELKDGSVLIVYYTEGKASEVRLKRFRVKREGGIEFLPAKMEG